MLVIVLEPDPLVFLDDGECGERPNEVARRDLVEKETEHALGRFELSRGVSWDLGENQANRVGCDFGARFRFFRVAGRRPLRAFRFDVGGARRKRQPADEGKDADATPRGLQSHHMPDANRMRQSPSMRPTKPPS